MTNEQKTEAPEQDWDKYHFTLNAVRPLLQEYGKAWHETEILVEGGGSPREALELIVEDAEEPIIDFINAQVSTAVGAAVRSTLESVICHIYDHGNGNFETDNGERAWLISDEILQAVIEPEAQQALDKLLGERDAEIARLRKERRNLALCIRHYFNNEASLTELDVQIDAALEAE